MKTSAGRPYSSVIVDGIYRAPN
ncbi:uncharacterized protein METZ01_LOCUS259809 [marine metagenome]|uniref:Uncharacterized protein n=1 Tax=marine metagenome TaxID=408172 RepID=A0A382J5W3_9ZZZZ